MKITIKKNIIFRLILSNIYRLIGRTNEWNNSNYLIILTNTRNIQK